MIQEENPTSPAFLSGNWDFEFLDNGSRVILVVNKDGIARGSIAIHTDKEYAEWKAITKSILKQKKSGLL